MINVRQALRLALVFVGAHLAAYLVAGMIAIQFFYPGFWDGPTPLFQPFLRTMNEPELWSHAVLWQFPGQIARALLMALVLLPIAAKLQELTFGRRFLFLGGLLFFYTHLLAAAPSPANIEGFIYMRPEFVRAAFWRCQPEMVLYALLAGFLMARFLFKRKAGPQPG
jgi:hypothetical protein